MARRKKPEHETKQEAGQRQMLEIIANSSTRSEKTSWNRKMDNMIKLLSKLEPVKERIILLIKNEKQPIMDEIQVLRKEMIDHCVHPFEHLVVTEEFVSCKFCNRRFNHVR